MPGHTSMKGAFDAKDHNGRATINDGNIAYNRRHHVHDNGQIGQQNTSYVTDSQTRFRWIQPKQTDDGATASMGQVGVPSKKK